MYLRTLNENNIFCYIHVILIIEMATLIFYLGGSAAAYWIGTNIMYRSANAGIDWLLNSKANPDIKETHTVTSILSMLEIYRDLQSTHPAHGAMLQVKEGLRDLREVIERAKLRYEAHRGGYVTRFRTFDASDDNAIIEKKASELMTRLELFTNLMKLPPGATPVHN